MSSIETSRWERREEEEEEVKLPFKGGWSCHIKFTSLREVGLEDIADR